MTTGYLDGPSAVTRRVFKATYQSADGKVSGETKTVFQPGQLLQMDAVLDGKFLIIFE